LPKKIVKNEPLENTNKRIRKQVKIQNPAVKESNHADANIDLE